MIITAAACAGFRNLQDVFVQPSPEVNILFGDNGQGKTSFLEALWMFSAGASFRTGRISETIGFDNNYARLTLSFFCADREQEAVLILEKNPVKKIFTVNGVERKIGDEIDLPMVLFRPDDLEMVKNGPQERREMLDTVLSQLSARYKKNLQEYGRCLLQRNTLLKTIGKQKNSRQNAELLDVLDVALAKLGVYLTVERRKLSLQLADAAGRLYDGISGRSETFTVEYCSGIFETAVHEDRARAELDYYEAVCARRQEDVALGFTTAGAHRDDLLLLLDGRPARSYGSQGQQRTAAISCKLACAEVFYAISGERPVVLLDDVFSELDDGRKQYIFDIVTDNQIFLTGCDEAYFRSLTPKERRVRRFCVSAGRLLEV